jgi:hypothetical protein
MPTSVFMSELKESCYRAPDVTHHDVAAVHACMALSTACLAQTPETWTPPGLIA